VKDLKNMGIWEKVKEAIVEYQGDISEIPGIPQHIKEIYKTSFTTSPLAVIEVAARAQKWVDQALSRNMYLETRDIDETMKIYQTAWEKGLKSTYYLHMKPRHTAEQSTVAVNKAQKIGKLGFGALKLKSEAQVAPQPFAAPLQKTLDISTVAPSSTPSPREAMEVPGTLFAAKSQMATETVVRPLTHVDPVVLVQAKTAVSTVSAISTKPTVSVAAPSGGAFAKAFRHDIAKTQEKIESSVRTITESVAPAKKGFMSLEELKKQTVPVTVLKNKDAPKVCPVDPAERAQCDSCQ